MCEVFQKGEYVIHGSNGVCLVTDITHLDMPGSDRKRLYYVLQPLNVRDSRIYSPVDNTKVLMRKILSREERRSCWRTFRRLSKSGFPMKS